MNSGQELDVTWEESIRANDLVKVKHFTRLSETVMKRQNALLAHMIRADADDLLKGITMIDDLQQWASSPKRVGRPREKLMASNCEYYWNKRYAGELVCNECQVDKMIDDAQRRKFSGVES